MNSFRACWRHTWSITLPVLFTLALSSSNAAFSHVGRFGACPESSLIPYTALPFATERGIGRRCSLLRLIEDRGQPIPDPLRGQVLKELTNRYAIEIDYTGVVSLPGDVIDYLLENIRETAMLVSFYSGNEYQATQIDPWHGSRKFVATNNDTFFAGFTYLYSGTSLDSSEHMFFESGYARVLFWRIWGNSLIRYTLHKNGDGTSSYDIRVFVFTESRLLRAILSSRLFLRFSREMFEDILRDIESATHRFSVAPNPEDHLPARFARELKTRLQ